MLSTAEVHDVETTSPACFGKLVRDMSKTQGAEVGGGRLLVEQNHENCKNIFWALLVFEARRETTCIQGYRPCPQKTGLHRQGSRGVVLSMKRKQRS